MKKYINSLNILNPNISSKKTSVSFNVTGDKGAVFSLRIEDSSGKFYNFQTSTFTTAYTAKNVLKNQKIFGIYSNSFVAPANTSGDTYTVNIFAEPHFDTALRSRNSIYTQEKVSQSAERDVVLGLASDQSSSKFDNLYDSGDATTFSTVSGSSNMSEIQEVDFDVTVSDPASPALGYKVTAPNEGTLKLLIPTIDDSLKPRDEDFYTEITDQTNGSGSSSTSMILDSVDYLDVNMHLAAITSSSVTTSGSLGVLTYPTITAINQDTKTVTLSSAHSWADNKGVTFRAYGSDLIRSGTGADIEFVDFKYTPGGAKQNLTHDIQLNGSVVVNGAVSGSTSIAVDAVSGVSAGSKLIGGSITEASNANVITAVHASGTPLTVTANQTLFDNTTLYVYGSVNTIKVTGKMKVKTFPNIDLLVYLDIDRGFILGTTS